MKLSDCGGFSPSWRVAAVFDSHTCPAAMADTVEYGALESAPVEHEPDSKKYRRSRVAYWIMILLGAGLLLPWNAVVSVVDYFKVVYPGFAIEFYLGMFYIYPQLPVLAVMVKWGDRVSFTIRIACCFILMAVVLALIPVTTKVLSSEVSRYVTLGCVFVSGLATAVLQSSIFGFASQFPPIYNQAIMAGQGVAGVGACVMRILTKLVLTDVTASAMVYFFMSSFILVLCTVAYFWLLRLPFTQYHLERSKGFASPGRASPAADDVEGGTRSKRRRSSAKKRRPKKRSPILSAGDGTAESSPLLGGGVKSGGAGSINSDERSPVLGAAPAGGAVPAVDTLRLARQVSDESSVTSTDEMSVGEGHTLQSRVTLRWLANKPDGVQVSTPLPTVVGDSDGSVSSDDDSVADESACQNYTKIVKSIWPFALTEVLIFIMTFSVFPGEISVIPYQGTIKALDFLGETWWSIVLITCFNVFDLCGRSGAAAATIWTEKTILIPALLRFALIWLFVVVAYKPGGFFSDIFSLVMVAVFAITNGHVASVGMMHAPSRVGPHDRERAGFLMSLFLQLGIFVGSQTALVVQNLRP